MDLSRADTVGRRTSARRQMEKFSREGAPLSFVIRFKLVRLDLGRPASHRAGSCLLSLAREVSATLDGGFA